jgi:phosphoribosylanthranilate isomerase
MQKEHVHAAVQNGVDFIGFMFAPSKRRISISKAIELRALIPQTVKVVGVFVNEEAETIKQIAQQVKLDFIQYHGDETPEQIEAIGLPAIKALSIRSLHDIERAATYNVDYFLFDAPGTQFRGGSGHSFDWTLLQKANIEHNKVILAGGLNADNVLTAIHIVSPYAVDVSSGVEKEGTKDEFLISQFINVAKGVHIL